MTKPSEDERRNGWTEETLTRYLAEQAKAQTLKIDPQNRRKPPMRANNKYRPLRWQSR